MSKNPQALRTEQDSAVEVAASPGQLAACSTSQYEQLRAYLLSDSYAFTKVVCGHKDLIPEFHMPLSYLMCGLTRKLVDLCLNDKRCDSYVTRAIRRELWRRKIDWNTTAGFQKLDTLLDLVNIRVYRGSFKSSIGTHGGVLFTATRDPNETIWIVSNSDENAWAFCEQIGDTMLKNPVYAALFPDRIPKGNLKELVTQRRVMLDGRTISTPQANIEADGYLTKRISAHFGVFWIDDLVVKENATPMAMKGVKGWLAGLTGFEMATRRTRRVHQGTIWGDDDHKVLSRPRDGEKFTDALNIVIPIEVYDGGYVENILERGTPTNPRLHPSEKIQAMQAKTLADPEEGAISWRCNYLLDASAAGGKVFPDAVVNDPERHWHEAKHPNEMLSKMGHFLVQRLKRDKEARPIVAEGWKGAPDDPQRFSRFVFDPWRDLDRVIVIDPSWSEGGDNWAATCTGDDHEQVRFQLETTSGEDGVEGWVPAVLDMIEFWNPRLVGYDANANQDAVIKNLFKIDRRLKHVRHLFVPVPSRGNSKIARIKNFVAEPLKIYRLLLDPADHVTKAEMTAYRGDRHAVDGILDSIAMAQAVHVRKSSGEEREKRMARLAARNAAITRSIDPYTGVPYVAA